MVPKGLTVREQLEAWRDSQPEERRESALRLAGLRDLYATILSDGELSRAVQFSLQSPRMQKKLLAVGIDVETTWVAMAKVAIDPTKNWFASTTTRADAVELLRPYAARIGGTEQLSRIFFGGKDLDRFFWAPPKNNLPGFETLVAILKFCRDDIISGGERLKWTSAQLTFMEAQWNVFGRGNLPLPELTGEEEFKDWICRRIPHERVDHVAKMLNDVLGKQVFSSVLLISWRKGSLPTKDKLEALLRGIQRAFPEWLEPEDPQRTAPPAFPESAAAPPTEPPAPAATTPELSSVSAVLAELAECISSILPRLNAAERDLLARVTETSQSPVSPSPAKTQEDPGEVVDGLRFVLTASSFRRVDVFNLDEVEDTEKLIGEFAHRLALMNSMRPRDKSVVLRRFRPAFNELHLQMRHMDAQPEDLPALFLDMRITAAALAGKDLDKIKA